MNRLQFEAVVDELARMAMRRVRDDNAVLADAIDGVAQWWIGDHTSALRALSVLKHTMHIDAVAPDLDYTDMILAEVIDAIATVALRRDIAERASALRYCGVEVSK